MTLPVVRIDSDLKWRNLPSRQYMQDGELGLLLTLVDSVKPHSVIEFGVNEGLTARAVLQYIDGIERYVGIDVPFDYRTEIPTQQSEVPREPGRLVKDDTRFKLVIRHPDFMPFDMVAADFDVAFIDGDHGRNAVRHDYDLARLLVRPGGIIIFHDYNNTTVQVTEALDALHERGSKIASVEGTWIAFERL